MKSGKLNSILVCTDLSGSPDEALRTAAGLAERAGAQLHALHAFDLSSMPYATAKKRATFPERVTACERALEEQIQRELPPTIEVASRQVVIRTPYLAIIERAREVQADLIVLGPHKKHVLGEGILGSTSEKVLRASDMPCLIVRVGLSFPLRRIVVPIDLSEAGQQALDVGLTWASRFGESDEKGTLVDVLHVAPKEFDTSDFPFGETVIVPEVRKAVDEALDRAGGAVSASVEPRLVWGDRPADVILQEAASSNADLIVLGTHGHGAMRRALIGSVATVVARRADCAVLLIPPRSLRSRDDATTSTTISTSPDGHF